MRIWLAAIATISAVSISGALAGEDIFSTYLLNRFVELNGTHFRFDSNGVVEMVLKDKTIVHRPYSRKGDGVCWNGNSYFGWRCLDLQMVRGVAYGHISGRIAELPAALIKSADGFSVPPETPASPEDVSSAFRPGTEIRTRGGIITLGENGKYTKAIKRLAYSVYQEGKLVLHQR
jgi:hypothetical protein